MNRPRRVIAVVVAAGALALSGCGVGESIVHLQPAPTEDAEVGAPLRAQAAEQIAARVLSQAAAAQTEEERAAIYVGPALRVASARAARGAPAVAPADVVAPSSPSILAMSRGQEWPRAILAATLDSDTSTQHLSVLVSTGPADQFKLYGTASMLPGTSVPALGDLAGGTPFAAATPEVPIEGSAVVDEYARGLAFPTPGETSVVGMDDAFAQSLQRNSAAQEAAFNGLATLTRAHAAIPDSLLSFETADGGRLVFAQMTRQATIALAEEAKEVKIEDQTLRELSGKETVTESFLTEHLENLLFVAPPTGLARLIGAEEVLVRAEGS